ncbi:hypothetical protein [Paenibacillus sp. Marseille-Q4541]|uniref:hypothetical protein n=1 Tax=Paenibacillus sp. Marseille-Q4541 TaxID=2831522 RepID=UPI001BAD46C6|nr:hypothetical protein [Paenibacillus sp. Marseille-Q4541]
MKKGTIFWISILFILTALSIVLVIKIYPKEVKINEQGIKYKLGDEQGGSEQLVDVNIEGHLYQTITGKRRFEGTIDIEGEEISVPVDQRKLNIPFSDEGWGAIDYPYFLYRKKDNAITDTAIYQYGSLVINRDFSKVSIMVAEQPKQPNGDMRVSWRSEDGQMITVPASSRSEAIRLSNEIMKEFLKGLQLK